MENLKILAKFLASKRCPSLDAVRGQKVRPRWIIGDACEKAGDMMRNCEYDRWVAKFSSGAGIAINTDRSSQYLVVSGHWDLGVFSSRKEYVRAWSTELHWYVLLSYPPTGKRHGAR
jgi:hypothetical protein